MIVMPWASARSSLPLGNRLKTGNTVSCFDDTTRKKRNTGDTHGK
jgi:hypothetical protein